MWWVIPLIIGAAFWAAADTISDAVITDHTSPTEKDVERLRSSEDGLHGMRRKSKNETELKLSTVFCC